MAVRRICQPGWFLFLALTLGGPVLGGAVARAACGDHARAVLVLLDTRSVLANLGQPTMAPEGVPLPTDLPRRCTGPSCSRQPAAPMAIPEPDRPPTDSGLDPVRAIPPRPLAVRPVVASPRTEYASPAADPLDRPPRP